RILHRWLRRRRDNSIPRRSRFCRTTRTCMSVSAARPLNRRNPQAKRPFVFLSVCFVGGGPSLNGNSARSGHSPQVQPGAAEPTGCKALHLDIHCDRSILVKESAWLDHDAFARAQRSLEDIAIAVQDKEAGLAAGDEAIHKHALTTEKNIP